MPTPRDTLVLKFTLLNKQNAIAPSFALIASRKLVSYPPIFNYYLHLMETESLEYPLNRANDKCIKLENLMTKRLLTKLHCH